MEHKFNLVQNNFNKIAIQCKELKLITTQNWEKLEGYKKGEGRETQWMNVGENVNVLSLDESTDRYPAYKLLSEKMRRGMTH